MDHANITLYIEKRCSTYHEQLPWPDSSWPEDIRRGYTLMNEQLFRTGSTVALVKAMNGTPQKNFSGRFRRHVGMEPRVYRSYHRVEAAKMLLTDEKLKHVPLDEIAYAVGWERPHSFSITFKKYTGLTPGEWREQQLKKGG